MTTEERLERIELAFNEMFSTATPYEFENLVRAHRFWNRLEPTLFVPVKRKRWWSFRK